jgi:aspartyl-tRNA(Asn)/glutamyl-tRNA(Gln) amidotransferase subunit A
MDVLAPATNGSGSFQEATRAAVAGLRVGVPSAGQRGADPAVLAAFDQSLATMRRLGVEVKAIDEPADADLELANAAGLIVSRVEAAAYHRPWLERRMHYTDDVREQLDEAQAVSAIDYVQAQRYRSELSRRMLRLFERVDLLAMPTSKVPAPRPEESEAMLLVLSENCVPWSLIGFPAISLPCGAAPGNLPIGLELVGAPYSDRTVLALAAAFEEAAKISYV